MEPLNTGRLDAAPDGTGRDDEADAATSTDASRLPAPTGATSSDVVLARDLTPITIDEPPAPARIRRPPDLIRVIANFGGIVLLTLLGIIANATTRGLQADLTRGGLLAPKVITNLLLTATLIIMALVPIGLAVERVVRREARLVADGVLAAALTYLAGIGFNALVKGPMPQRVTEVLTRSVGTGHVSDPIHLYLASVVAFVTIVGFGYRHTVQTFMWTALVVNAIGTLIDGDTTLIAIICTLLFGRTLAFGWRYLRGAVNSRPTGDDVVATLAAAGVRPLACRWVPNPNPGEPRHYEVASAQHGMLDVIVMDRDQQAVGLPYRLYRRMRLRKPALTSSLLSLHRAMEAEALMSYAVRAAGIRTPELVALRELGPDAGLLAYQKLTGRTVAELDPSELTDTLFTEICRLTLTLHQRQLAHRRLSPEHLLVDDAGRLWLTELRGGEVAASSLQLNLDTAELMAAFSVSFGAERTVRIASQVLGSAAVAATMPLLQPVMLTRATRGATRRAGDLLRQLREAILELHPRAEAEPVRLERLRPRTVLTVVGGAVALYFLLSELTQAPIGPLFTSMSWTWFFVGVLASAATYPAAAMGLAGFVPDRLPRGRLVLAQLAASFVTIVTPASVGGIALNTRFLQRAKVKSGLAVTSVGASQIVAFVVHILLIMMFGFISGSQQGPKLPAANALILILLAFAVAALLVAAIPPARHYALAKLGPFFSGVMPRMLDVLQNPVRLAVGVGGATLLCLMNILCLWASLHAFRADDGVSFANIAFVWLTTSAIGSVIPTPGGTGGVETTMTLALGALGVPAAAAVATVVLFRLLTLWLPVAPGWFAFTAMQRREWL